MLCSWSMVFFLFEVEECLSYVFSRLLRLWFFFFLRREVPLLRSSCDLITFYGSFADSSFLVGVPTGFFLCNVPSVLYYPPSPPTEGDCSETNPEGFSVLSK